MSGIYIHIPFCKQACHYCDFHFSTSMKKKDAMLDALAAEIRMRKTEFKDEIVETIYFGGGTPSVLSSGEINNLIAEIYQNYTVSDAPEITLEGNPDDLSDEKIAALAASRVNRLSIGIQSFFEDDLRLMNRAHNAEEAKRSLAQAVKHFSNISIDLIYGIPGMDDQKWKKNIETALAFGVPHISSYALTVEPKTALKKLIAAGKIQNPSDEAAQQHFSILVEMLESKGFVHYELSNFAKPGFFSRNNSAYWLGKKYLGIGPSAHSYDAKSRIWNIAYYALYIDAIASNRLPSETETLSVTDQYNEYIMTGLRTIWGVSLEKISREYGQMYHDYVLGQSRKFVADGLLSIENQILTTTKKGKFLADGIASDLFFLNLE